MSLRDAARGLPDYPTWTRGLSDVISKLGSSNDESWQHTSSQKTVYKELVANKFGNTLNDTFERRLTSLFQPYELDFQQAILLDRCWAALKKCRVADAVKSMKT